MTQSKEEVLDFTTPTHIAKERIFNENCMKTLYYKWDKVMATYTLKGSECIVSFFKLGQKGHRVDIKLFNELFEKVKEQLDES